MTLEEISFEMKTVLSEVSHTHKVVEEYPWSNDVYHSELFNWGHVEYYEYRTAKIVHCVIMPHANDTAGIFGFDVIEINGTRTGLFIDITPTVGEYIKLTEKDMGEPRPLPEWAKFSPSFIAVKPFDDSPKEGLEIMKRYLDTLQVSFGDEKDILSAQQKYSDMQRQNEKTLKMLTSHIGEEKALKFMKEVMFPDSFRLKD